MALRDTALLCLAAPSPRACCPRVRGCGAEAAAVGMQPVSSDARVTVLCSAVHIQCFLKTPRRPWASQNMTLFFCCCCFCFSLSLSKPGEELYKGQKQTTKRIRKFWLTQFSADGFLRMSREIKSILGEGLLNLNCLFVKDKFQCHRSSSGPLDFSCKHEPYLPKEFNFDSRWQKGALKPVASS